MKLCLVVAGCLLLSLGKAPGEEEPVLMYFPKDKPIIEFQFPNGFKAAFRKDGTCLAVGPKTVMALVAFEKAKDAATAMTALPEFAKTFVLRSLSFRDVNVLGVEKAKMPRMYDDGETIGAETLTASGKNSDGEEMFISAAAFPWEHHFYVLFAVSKPADKEQLLKDQRSVLESVNYVNDD